MLSFAGNTILLQLRMLSLTLKAMSRRCVCIYVRVPICTCVYRYACVRIYKSVRVCMRVSVSVCVFMSVYVWVRGCICIYVCILYVCTYDKFLIVCSVL